MSRLSELFAFIADKAGILLGRPLLSPQKQDLTRLLKEVRAEHPFLYAGLRYMMDGSSPDDMADWLEGWTDKFTRSPNWLDHSPHLLLSYKETNNKDQHGYRETWMLPPSMAALELVGLGRLRRDPAFAVPASVWSHRWARGKGSTRLFEYFWDPYLERTRSVQACLDEHRDAVAVVLDIKSFFPSVSKKLALARFDERLAVSQIPREEHRFFAGLARYVVSSGSSSGLPIGPLLSPVLSSILLRDVDTKLARRFPLKYSRYVDDIVVVVSRGEEQAAISAIGAVLGEERLRINEGKTDVLDATLWQQANPEPSAVASRGRTGRAGLSALREDVRDLLMVQPRLQEEVEQVLLSEGVVLPIRRVAAASRDPSVQRMTLRERLVRSKPWVVQRAWSEDLGSRVRSAKAAELRAAEALLAEQDRGPQEAHPTLRRRRVSQLRRVLRAMVSINADWDARLVEEARAAGAHDYAAVAEVAQFGADPSTLLPFPGAALRALGETWMAAKRSPATLDSIPQARPQIHALATLLLFAVVRPIPGLEVDAESKPVDMELLAFSQHDERYPVEVRCDFVSEVRGLQKRHGPPPADVLATRLSFEEDAVPVGVPDDLLLY